MTDNTDFREAAESIDLKEVRQQNKELARWVNNFTAADLDRLACAIDGFYGVQLQDTPFARIAIAVAWERGILSLESARQLCKPHRLRRRKT